MRLAARFPTEAWAPQLLSLTRFMVGLVYMQHGAQKLLGFPDLSKPADPLLSLNGAAGVMDLFGGLLIALGLFTRPVAFLLSGEMAVGYFMVHLPRSFYPFLNNGDLCVVFCFVYLYLSAAGPGPWRLDALLAKRAASLSTTAAA